jgi:phenylalanine ammonia-lyase
MRLALHHMGHHCSSFSRLSHLMQPAARLTYSQLTELLNIHLNKGAPPDLSVGEPSVDYCMKGSDIAAASYLSGMPYDLYSSTDYMAEILHSPEIAYLANPVSTHINSAEMMNQFVFSPRFHDLTGDDIVVHRAINPLALISARYTLEAVKLVRMVRIVPASPSSTYAIHDTQIMSTHLYALVQAADIRAMEIAFRSALFDVLRSETISHFPESAISANDDEFFQQLVHPLVTLLNVTTGKDSGLRFKDVFAKLVGHLLVLLLTRAPRRMEVAASALDAWREALAAHAQRLFVSVRDAYVPGPVAPAVGLLGRTSALYVFVRGELGVGLHWGDPERDRTEIGTEIGKIFRAFDGRRMMEVLLVVLDQRE